MYQPAGAILRLDVRVTDREVLVLEAIGKSTSRCSVSSPWVVAIGLIKLTHWMFCAWGVVTVNVLPREISAGAF